MDIREFVKEALVKEVHEGYDLYQPVSLPHNRYPSGMFVVKLWVWIGFGMIGLLGVWAFYLWIRT
jgi:hypothetical protein